MGFERVLMGQEPVQRAIEPVVIDLGLGQSQQIVQRRAPEPVLGDVQFTGGFAEPRDHQHRRHQAPGDVFTPSGQSRLQPLVESQRLPEFPGKPDVAEPPAAFEAESPWHHGDGIGREFLVEEPGLTFDADD